MFYACIYPPHSIARSEDPTDLHIIIQRYITLSTHTATVARHDVWRIWCWCFGRAACLVFEHCVGCWGGSLFVCAFAAFARALERNYVRFLFFVPERGNIHNVRRRRRRLQATSRSVWCVAFCCVFEYGTMPMMLYAQHI